MCSHEEVGPCILDNIYRCSFVQVGNAIDPLIWLSTVSVQKNCLKLAPDKYRMDTLLSFLTVSTFSLGTVCFLL